MIQECGGHHPFIVDCTYALTWLAAAGEDHAEAGEYAGGVAQAVFAAVAAAHAGTQWLFQSSEPAMQSLFVVWALKV